jgi:hypothetical protein
LDFDGAIGDPDAVPTIQHVSGNSNDPSNLKAFCRRCNNADAQSKFVPVVPGSPEAQMAAELRARWLSTEPLRLCDEDQRWSGIWWTLATSAQAVVQVREGWIRPPGGEDLPVRPMDTKRRSANQVGRLAYAHGLWQPGHSPSTNWWTSSTAACG